MKNMGPSPTIRIIRRKIRPEWVLFCAVLRIRFMTEERIKTVKQRGSENGSERNDYIMR